jgi:3-hydroxybutyryl-CoA dehydrogenase
MKIVVVADEALKKEILEPGLRSDVQVEWMDTITNVPEADCYIDLLFNNTTERIEALKKLQPATIIVNAVIEVTNEFAGSFVRINGWPGFLRRNIIETSCKNDVDKYKVEKYLTVFNKTVEWVPDIAGFISARVISMIINEAYYALDENVSSKDEIDIAMKLGTNYPFGPFEWSKKIGLKNVYDLLQKLSISESRYKPSPLLSKEALA